MNFKHLVDYSVAYQLSVDGPPAGSRKRYCADVLVSGVTYLPVSSAMPDDRWVMETPRLLRSVVGRTRYISMLRSLGNWQEYVATELRAGDDPDIGAMIGMRLGSKFAADTRITRR